MKFLLDENIDARLLPFLVDLGHDVTSVAKDYFYGLLDEDVLALAHQEHRILVTNDRDFGELMISVLLGYLITCSFCNSSWYARATIEAESTTGSASARASQPCSLGSGCQE